jgi:molybdopterin converting factor small subunit
MGRISIELSPIFASRIGQIRLDQEIANGEETVRRLLGKLGTIWGERLQPLLLVGDGGVLPGLMVMVNNRLFTASALNEEEVPLKDGDKLSLLYFVSGG